MDLIPGLPHDIGLECLIRVPYDHFSSVSSVCRKWKAEMELPEFRRHRKFSGASQSLFVMAQSRVDRDQSGTGARKSSVNPVYQLTICEPETGKWSELLPVPGYSNGLPVFCRVTSVGSNLVVMGGLDPVTWEVSNAVFVYNFVSATWKRGADMPGGPRSFFACASDLDRTVYIAGGHDKEKNALRSAMAYDVANDEWVQLPDMAMDRDECKGVFHGGKFHVIGGYNTEMQGQFGTSAEAFGIATWKWDLVNDDFLDTATCSSICSDGGDGRLYMCRANEVVVLQGTTWKIVTELPADVQSRTTDTWQGRMFVMGCRRFGEAHKAYVLDLKNYKWTNVEVPEYYSGPIQSGCWLDL
ncbi:F-box/kelch-repeat protein [Actinidia chinensis var. chinensis]|uniref:F-box/kelch-repeat protein n=1 Tax=Actinidia chinensis var. chinensis TaxID=1590841 RepID=A0A2R6QFU6_ACTCC|nr:F-box/kelch-repeat protein [Actinidia chinensis var. chinensis]